MYIDGLTCDNIGSVDLRLPTRPVPVTTTFKCTTKYFSLKYFNWYKSV